MQRQTNTRLAHRQKNISPATIPEKAIILHTLEDADMSHIPIFRMTLRDTHITRIRML
jgi:hypothetical protein